MASGQAGLESFLEDITPFFYRRSLTYVDVGAYRGEVFEKVLASKLKVREAHLVEPNPHSLQVARKNLEGVFKGHSLNFYQLAVGETSGRQRMAAAKDMTRVLSDGEQRLTASDADAEVFEVDCATLDELAKRFTERRISLLKIDVEGFEDKVLAGAASLLADQRVDVIYVEAGMNPDGTQQCYYRKIEDILASHHYRLFRIYEQKAEWMQDSPLLRRVNMAFMSQRFADANPYRLTMELYQVQKDLAQARSEIDAGVRRQAELDAAHAAALESARRAREEGEARVKLALKERDVQRAAAEAADRARAVLQIRLGELQARGEEALRARAKLTDDLAAARAEQDRLKQEIAAFRARTSQIDGERRQVEASMASVLQAVEETNARMLATQSEAAASRHALGRLQRSRVYRMARAVADNRRSPKAWLSVIPALWQARLRLPKPVVPRGSADDPRTHTMSLRGARSTLTLPLVKPAQTIALPPSATPYDVWIKTFCAEARDSLRVALALRGEAGAALPVVDVCDAGGTHHELVPGGSVKLPVLAGRTMRFLQVPASEHGLLLDLRSLSVRRCAARLELHVGRLVVGQQLTVPQPAPAAEPAPTPERVRALADAVRGNDGSAASGSEQLDWKLWGGYAPYAIEALERRKADPSVPLREREAASWYLARWYFVEEKLDRVLEEIAWVKGLLKKPQRRVPLLEIQTLLLLGRPEEALACLEQAEPAWPADKYDLLLLRSTVLRALALSRGQTLAEAEALQLEALNAAYRKVGLAPLAKQDPALPLALSNLAASATAGPGAQDRKVSVIVPAYNAEESIEWVVDGLLRQTWQNLEVIVVDDLSSDGTCAKVEAIAKRDPRVRLISKPVNEGAYPTRNAGARAATGDYITVHDSDDWSHPQKIELQVKSLEAHPQNKAVITHWVRVNENLEIVGPWIPRGNLFDVNFSSLMFERSLLEQTGFWDGVKISGDAEFFYRLRAVFGPDTVHKMPSRQVLSLSLVREDSLTRAKATHLRSLFYGLRWNYRDAYLWRLSRLDAASDPRPVERDSGRRFFPVPIGCLPKRPERSDFGLVVICDFAEAGEPLQRALAALAAARQAGQRAGAFHWRKYERSARALLQPAFYETVMRDGVEILSPGDQAQVDTLLVFDAAILNHRIDPAPQVSARCIAVIVDAAAGDPSKDVDRTQARAHLHAMFGAEPEFIPAGEAVSASIAGLLERLATPVGQPARALAA